MRSRFFRALSVCALVTVLATVLSAAISIPTGSPYSQTLDTLGIPASTTAASTLPADFRVDNPAAVRSVGSFASALTATARGGGANLSSSAANGIYNFGAGTTSLGNSDRAVGFLSSGTATQSGNLYAQLANNTGGDLTGLTISYNVEKYRLGINPAGFCIQLYYSSTGAAPWTSAGPSFLTTFGQDGGTVNSGYATVPGDVKAITNQTLSVAIPNGSNIYLAWNYSVCTGSTTTNAQALAIDDISVLGVSASNSTSPTGTMSASPSSVSPGDSITFTANVVAGTNPSSTGLTVTADLTSIGLGTPTFTDLGGGVFRFTGTIPSSVTGGARTLTASIADDQHRSGTTAPSTTVTIVTPTSPSGSGSSNPATVAPGGSTTLTVNVTPGANPASTGLTVTGDLTAIGGSATQAFTDNGGNSFSAVATVANGTADGSKAIPISITDAQGRSGAFNLALNVATPFSGSTVRISQVYGGGGNSGATFTNDFVELFNQGTLPVDIANWSVQVASAGATAPWNVTPLCPAGPCVIQPGHYFLVQEAIGGTTLVQVPLPAADAFGSIAMSATNAKVALVANSAQLAGSCPAGGLIVDMVGYGSASCFETLASGGLSNTTADVRRGNGCTDTDNNSQDFVENTPIPRNSASPAHVCGDAAHLRALGLANPQGVEHGGLTTFTVQVFPAGGGSTGGTSVTADLSSLGGGATQPFFDDGTNGDLFANDGTFSFQIRLSESVSKGAHAVNATVSDGLGGTLVEPMTLSVILPTCGTERWAVKVGDDAAAPQVDLAHPVPTDIQTLRSQQVPVATLNPNPPYDPRFQNSAEMNAWVLNATMTLFKKETDVDYHIVLSDTSGTIVSEIPEPDCSSDASPFRPGMAAARAAFDARLTATSSFQSVSLPVRVTGVGFFDFVHGQTGVAPNGIEIHPIVDIVFQSVTATTVTSSANPSTYQNGVDFTATVSSTGPVPTGQVTFFDGGSALAALNLDPQGHAVLHTTALAVGQHAITASYAGDEQSTGSRSPALTQTVNQADQTITFDPLPGKTFGDADFTVTATASSGLGVTLTASGPATLSGNTVHLTGAGAVTIRAAQAGDGNYNAAQPVDRSFDVARASQVITFGTPVPAPQYGAQPFEVMATGGGSGNPVTFTAHGTCTAVGQNGIATVTIVSGGECDVVASQAGNGNYTAAPDKTEVITIGRATADAKGKPVTVVYDGQPHGLTGKAVGVLGEDLTSLLNLGATFTNVPGGTANWSFAGNENYLPLSGSEAVTITPAAPVLSGLGAPVIEAGTATTAISGVIGVNSVIPSGSVGIVLGGVTLQAPINPATGAFSATFATGSLTVAHGPYAVTFTYAGDTNFTGATGASTLTVVDTLPPVIGTVTASPSVVTVPNHKMFDVLVDYTTSDVSGAPACTLAVTGNEPLNGTGDGNTATDWIVVDAHHVQLRAERAGTGSGRVYTITATCTDAFGNATAKQTTVSVPK